MRLLKQVITSLVLLFFVFSASVTHANSTDLLLLEKEDEIEVSFDTEEAKEEFEVSFDTEEAEDIQIISPLNGSSPWELDLLRATRFSLKHEYGSRLESPKHVVSNRSSLRIEFSKLFNDHYFIQIDALANKYWKNDHITKANEKSYLIRTVTKEAYLQMSYGESSLKIGKQILVWGEADGMAITDVISPRDYSEFYFIPLEESRLGQNLIVWDQYTKTGSYNLFFNPSPRLDKKPEKGSEYEVSSFDSSTVSIETKTVKGEEMGIRWKKTVGKLDIAIMVARLLSNQYSYTTNGTTADGRLQLVQEPYFYNLIGATFILASSNILWKGEVASKSNRAFNTSSYARIKKDVWDAYLGFEYSGGVSYTLGLDLFGRHISDWNDEILGTKQNEGTLGLNWNKTYCNEDLKLTFGGVYAWVYKDFMFSGQAEYIWNDNLKFEVQLFILESQNNESQQYIYRGQDRVTGKIVYQF